MVILGRGNWRGKGEYLICDFFLGVCVVIINYCYLSIVIWLSEDGEKSFLIIYL